MPLNCLQQTYLFQGIKTSDQEYAASIAREVICESGEYVYKKGDKGETFFVIAEGKVELVIEEHGRFDCVAGNISAGGHFGEVSLLTGKPRSLTVRTLTKTRFLVFNAEQFRTVLLANPHIHKTLDKALAVRLDLLSIEGHESGKSVGTSVDSLYDFEPAKKIKKQITHFAAGTESVLIQGEPGTGRRLAAKQIHLHSDRKSQPYLEFDIQQLDSWLWEEKLFGHKQDSYPYSAGRQLGVLEQINNGTLVLFHAESLSKGLQKKLYDAFTSGTFTTVDSNIEQPLGARLIVITGSDLQRLEQESVFIPELLNLFSGHQFTLPPLREHKQDIMPLIDYYLQRYSAELNTKVTRISPAALGMLMNYNWPGNLTELSDVIHRAVMVSPSDEIISEQIILGLPRTEGKLAYNLLRLPWVRNIFESNFLPITRKIIFALFALIVLILFFGPQDPQKNLGLTLCWHIGWPFLIISFFFLPRFWCSICALSTPGRLLQKLIRPVRRLPGALISRSGWIMAVLCLIVFWVEIVFNAYDSPRLTGMILLSISLGATLLSLLFERYTWCRYFCPLGALNAIFSMPSILELRANQQLCLNQCRDHVCSHGTNQSSGCPMFRHPFLVDNNKDCILCGKCIRNCRLRSIQLNLRLAPRELWSIRTPRLSDNFLVVSLGAISFFLTYHLQFLNFIQHQQFISCCADTGLRATVFGSLFFGGIITVSWCLYLLLSKLQSLVSKEDYRKVRTVFGYGLIPIILGGYLAFNARLFVQEAWHVIPNFSLLFGIETEMKKFYLLTSNGTATLLNIIILGGLLASLYATYKIFSRLEGAQITFRHLLIPFLFLLTIGVSYFIAI